MLSSLFDIKKDLSTEVRALTKRMSHIDEQISQIFKFLSPVNPSATDNYASMETNSSQQPIAIPQSSPMMMESLETSGVPIHIFPVFETPSFYSDLNPAIALFDANKSLSTIGTSRDPRRSSRTSEQSISTPPIRQMSIQDETMPSFPLPATYSRSASSSIISLAAVPSRSSVSNKIVPAPDSPTSRSPKQSFSRSFQPISNTRFNPGRSPKPKARSYHKRQYSQTDRSTIVELEPTVQSFLPATGKITKSSTSVFRRFIPSGNNTDKSSSSATASASTTLLYPPTSDDERPLSPISSGNEDDDHRPLTSSSKHHHQTLL